MKKRRFIAAFVLVNLTILPNQLALAACSGNACADIVVTRKNGCVYIVNNGDRRVKFSRGVGHSPTVYPGEEVKLLSMDGAMKGTGECMRNIGSDWKATYAD